MSGRLLWIVASYGELQMALVARAVVEAGGYEVTLASDLDGVAGLAARRGAKVTYLPEGLRPLDESRMVELDSTYSDPGIGRLALAEGAVRGLPPKTLEGLAGQYLDVFDNLQASYDAVVLWQTASLSSRAAHSVFRRVGKRALLFVNGPTFSRFPIADVDENEVWTELIALMAQGPRSLEDSESGLVDAHLAEISTLHPQFKPRATTLGPPLWDSLRYAVRRGRPRSEGTARYQERVLLLDQWRRCRWAWRRRLGTLPYESAPPGERYVYFPMQNPRDVKLVGRNPAYVDQIGLAAQIAIALPVGMTLYVREHPNHPGAYDVAAMSRLRRLGRVRLIDPHDSNQKLIQRAEALVVINSTASWEAYVWKVPCVLLGRSFLRLSRLVYSVDNLNDLAPAIRSAVRGGRARYETCNEEWRWFIWAALASCHPGYAFGYKEIFSAIPKQDIEANGRLLGEGVLRKLTAPAGAVAQDERLGVALPAR